VLLFFSLLVSSFTGVVVPVLFEKGGYYSYATYFESAMFAGVYCVTTFVIIVFMCSYISFLGARKNELKFILQKTISKSNLLLCTFVSNLIFSSIITLIILLPFISMLVYLVIQFQDIFINETGVNAIGLFFSFFALTLFSVSLVTSFAYFNRNSSYLIIIACAVVIIYCVVMPFVFPFEDDKLQIIKKNIFGFTSMGCLFLYALCPIFIGSGIGGFKKMINF